MGNNNNCSAYNGPVQSQSSCLLPNPVQKRPFDANLGLLYFDLSDTRTRIQVSSESRPKVDSQWFEDTAK